MHENSKSTNLKLDWLPSSISDDLNRLARKADRKQAKRMSRIMHQAQMLAAAEAKQRRRAEKAKHWEQRYKETYYYVQT